MSVECYPIIVLPHTTRLYADYLALADSSTDTPLNSWYGSSPAGPNWSASIADVNRNPAALADLLHEQSVGFGAGPAALANIEKLRQGARAIVTGQQVGLFGGPLLTLLKAATAVARAREASERSGIPHVPVFWLASEDHDLAEADQASIPSRTTLEKLSLGLPLTGQPAGAAVLGDSVNAVLDQVSTLLDYAPITDLLKQCYQPGATMAAAFARLMTRLFASHGLIVMDAAGEACHRLGAPALRAAITQAAELEKALLARTQELEAAGYNAQVLVNPGASLLFLLHPQDNRRLPLRRLADGTWKAGSLSVTEAELLDLLDREPQRLSPNALLRPIFQDTLLPTAAYIGGPAEIAYFAQSAVVYQRILGHLTPVLPRFSATLIEPALDAVMQKAELTLLDLMEARTVENLAQKLGARAMPIEGKRKLAAAGNAMDTELTALTSYLSQIDSSLGRSALVSASKMRYQMNRLRRMAATFEVQKEASLRKHANALMLNLFPDAHPQERVIAGVTFLARCGDDLDGLINQLVDEAAEMCLGHSVIRL